jgi:hypothetical protein
VTASIEATGGSVTRRSDAVLMLARPVNRP